jgi:hypothetical protein
MDLRERRADDARHPWEAARAAFFGGLVRRISLPPNPTVLDIGAGDGWLAMQLDGTTLQSPTTTCWDINYTDDDLLDASVRAGKVVRARDEPEGRFDLVLLLDVLEHIEDDEAFFERHVLPHVAPGGRLIVSVPVHPSLFTAHDTMLAHVRRYRVREIRGLLARHAAIEREGSLFTSLLAPRAIECMLNRVRPKEPTGIGSWNGGPLLTRSVRAALDADARFNGWMADRRWWTPGLSYWAVVRNSDEE